ncbi:hypothetical protein [Haloarchaeobius sp. DFWS5]|uniref:hypothetical protein n=1 Tax=Haloarchaeobius sp. DFWS5 TaxID=3446114 RepID=UPI003EB9D578
MRRRALLTTLASVGLAGCGAVTDRQTREPFGVQPTDVPPMVAKAGDPPADLSRLVRSDIADRTIAAVSFRNESRLDDSWMRYRAGITDAPTADSPAGVWVGVENTSDRTKSLELESVAPLETPTPDTFARTASILLVPREQ